MLTESVVRKEKKISPFLQALLYISISFIIAGTNLGRLRSPLNISLVAASSPIAALEILAGSLAEYLISPDKYQIPAVAPALISVAAFKWFSYKMTPMQNAILSAASIFAASFIDIFLYGFSIITFFTYLYTSVFMGALSYYFTILFSSEKDLKTELSDNKLMTAILYFLAIALLSSLSLSVINIGRVAGTIAVLMYARSYRYQGGAAAGVLTSLSMALYSDNTAYFFGAAGMIAGVFGRYKRSVAASVFLMVNIACGAAAGIVLHEIYLYIDILAGAIIFCFIPYEAVRADEHIQECSTDIMKMLSFRMRHMALSLDEANEKLRVNEKEKAKKQSFTNEDKIDCIFNSVCMQCSNRNYCWSRKRDLTYKAFLKACEVKNPLVSGLPSEFDYCFKKREIADELKKNTDSQIIDITINEYSKKLQEILSEQIKASSDIIKLLSAQKLFFDKRLTDRIHRCLTEADIGFSTAIAYYNDKKRFFAEIFCTKNACINGYQIYKAFTDEFCKAFDCTKYYDGEEMRFLICERPHYNIESYIMQCSASENQPNGDTCDCFKDDYGNVYIVISDGMGTGKNASVYSKTVINIFKKLILGGADVKNSIHMINSIMLAKDKSDMFATIDIARFDLDSGNMTVYKAGAAPTVFRHSGSVFRIHSDSYPVGIMNCAETYSKCIPLKADDTIIMFSDGVTEEMYGIIRQELMSNKTDISEISDRICKIASETAKDDISVVTAKLIRQ